MLVLSRKVGERILIGDNISVTVVRITGGGVRIGIEAPPDMTVIRQELREHVGDVRIEPGDVPRDASSAGCVAPTSAR